MRLVATVKTAHTARRSWKMRAPVTEALMTGAVLPARELFGRIESGASTGAEFVRNPIDVGQLRSTGITSLRPNPLGGSVVAATTAGEGSA